MGSSPFSGPPLGMGAERWSTKYGECLYELQHNYRNSEVYTVYIPY